MLSLRNFSLVLGLTAVSLSLVSACVITSETDDPSGPSYAHPSEADFCAALARAQCTDAAVKACYGSGDADVEADRSTCISRRSNQDTCRASVTGGVPISSVQYNPAQETQKCIDAQGAVYADAAINRVELDAAVLACIEIFSGEGTAGSSCENDYDCKTTDALQCIRKTGLLAGTCAVPTVVGGGEECMDPAIECAETYYCDASEGGSGACLKAKGADAACDAETACLEEYNCVITDPELEVGTCQAKLANGEACEADDAAACQGTFCNAPSGQTSGECVTNLALAGTSASCDAF
jgi:hypothetical protein